MQITKLPGADPTALVTTGRRMSTTEIVRTTGDIQITMTPSTTTTISRTSTEATLEREEVHHRTEILNQDQTTDRDLGTDTGHTAMTVTTGMLLHTEEETGEVLPHTTQEEEIAVTTMTSLHNTEGSHVVLHQDTAMMAGITNRALGLKEECLKDKEVEIQDSHQQEVDNLSSDRDLNLVVIERRTSNAEDAEELATWLKSARCIRIGGGNLAIVVGFTKGETATVTLELFSRRWREKMEDKTGTMMLRICISIDMKSLRKVVSVM